MAKNNMNLDAILGGFNQIKDTSDTLQNVGWDGLIEAEFIDLADKNNYAAGDNDESIKSLADQIEVVGLLNPLGVIKKGERYQLFSGERRYRAITTYLHWAKIPCRVFENTTSTKAQLMLHLANGNREYTAGQKLQLYEEYRTLLIEMKSSGEYTGALQKGIAELLNVSDRQVRTYQKLCEDLTPQEKQAVVSGELSINDALTTAAENEEKAKVWQMPEPPRSKQLDWEASAGTAPPEDSIDWEPIIAQSILNAYSAQDLYRQYVFEVPTPQEATKTILKTQYESDYSTVIFDDGITGGRGCTGKGMTITYKGFHKFLKYSEIDEAIRQLIRDKRLLSVTEGWELAKEHFEGGEQS